MHESRQPTIIIIGGGPAGSAAAIELLRRRVGRVQLFDRSVYPRLKVCGSGLSPNALAILESLEMKDKLAPKHLHMRGVTAIGPGGRSIVLRGQYGAWVVPRTELDADLLGEARHLGAEIHEGTRVRGLLRDETGRVRGVRTDDDEFEADLVICANGSPSEFERNTTPREGIRTIMGWWKGANLPAPDQGIFDWSRKLDGYYAWAFPEPGGVVNIGLTIEESSPHGHGIRGLFQDILDEDFADVLAGADQLGKWKGHPATVTTRISGELVESHCMWVGEAARLVCPGTVEGIGFALLSGRIAAGLIEKHFDPRRGFLPRHAQLYRAKLAMRMLPQFLAGEAFVKLMRSRGTVDLLAKVFDPQRMGQLAATFVGER